MVKRQDGSRRRDEILDAALSRFVTRGVLAVGIEEIRKAAGASPSSIYHQFNGITDIVVALVGRIAAQHYGALAEAAAHASSLETAVRAVVSAHLEWTFAHVDGARFLYQALAAELAGPDRKRIEARKREHRAAFEAAIAPWLTDTPLAAWSPLELSVLLLGPSHQACRLYLAGQPLEPAWMHATLPELAWRGIAAFLPAAGAPTRGRTPARSGSGTRTGPRRAR